MPVTSGERVLIHLSSRSSVDGWTGGVSDQDLISTTCGIGRTHVPRVLRPLLEEGLVLERTGRSPGKVRRVKVYSLSEKGESAASEVRERSMDLTVCWTDESGQKKQAPVSKALPRINSHLSELSMSPIPTEKFLSLDLEEIEWNDILWVSASLGKRKDRGPCLPQGWSPCQAPSPLKGQPFDHSQIERLNKLLEENGKVLVKGPGGSGKFHLIDVWARSRKKKVLWLEKGDREGDCLEGGPWDVLVLKGGGDPDPDSIIKGEENVSDIREESWPRELRSLPLIMTTSAEVEIEGPVLCHGGVRKEYFESCCLRAGLDRELSGELYSAFKGSPSVLEDISEMDGGRISELSDMDVEEAVLSLLIELK